MTAEAATREDLDQFKTFLLQQLSQHKTELSEQFSKATQAVESAHQISKQLQLGADISFTQFADVSREFSTSLASSTIEEEMEGLMADKCDNDLFEFFRQNLHEYEQGNATPIVKGRLRVHIQFWIDIGAPE